MNKQIKSLTLLIIMLSLVSFSAFGQNNQVLRRFAIFIGANDGGDERVMLRYAATDAESMASVMEEIGGIASVDRLILLDPDVNDIERGFRAMGSRIDSLRDETDRVELLVYYSGHSDEYGLLLKGDNYPYREFRNAIEDITADVHIAILDSCSSGSFTRLKGGQRQHPFLMDESVDTSGYAFLTSSSENEAAQESDALEGSFFTHYLLSGLRGAADHTRNGQVSLNEAYSFASEQTLARTEQTMAGPQHPSYDMKLTGSGDLILTDLRASTAGLILQADVAGRLFIRDHVGKLIAEINKMGSEMMMIALPEGRYTITLEREEGLGKAILALRPNQTLDLFAEAFDEQERELTRLRGDSLEQIANLKTETRPGDSIQEPSLSMVETPLVIDSPSTITPQNSQENLEYRDFEINLFTYGGENLVVGALALNMMGTLHSVTGGQIGMITNLLENLEGVQYGLVLNNIGGTLEGAQIAGVANTLRGKGDGAQIAGVYNIALNPLSGAQVAGVFNTASNSVDGAQVAGVFNTTAQGTQGAQVSGVFNTTALELKGAQIAGVFNVAGTGYSGIQIGGVFNYANNNGAGPQIAGVFNRVERTLGGFQISGVYNWVGGSLYGMQVSGVFNRAGDVTGGQVGLVNVGRDVKGTQIGLVNISKSLSGLPLGLINISADGVTGVTGWSDSFGFTYGGIQFGTRRAYTFMVGGTSVNEPGNPMAVATGMGLHMEAGNLYLDTDIGAKVFFTQAEAEDWGTLTAKRDFPFPTAKVMAGVRIFKYLSIFGGLSIDAWVNDWNTGWESDGFYPLGAGESVEHYTLEGIEISYVPRWFIGIRI